jgi:1-deoxypentalenic acid 11beta-hydroxylase
MSNSLGRFVEANQCLDNPKELEALFNRKGYLFFRNVLDADQVKGVKEDFMDVLKSQGAVAEHASEPIWTGVGIDKINDNELYAISSYQELCESEKSVSLLEKVFEQPVFVFRNTSVRYSLPADDIHTTPAHQDNYFIGPTADFRTLWIPLMDIDEEVGGLCVAAGSHLGGLREHIEDENYESYILTGRKQKAIPLDTIQQEWLTTDYRPGDAILFHSHTIHRSLPNRSNLLRLSIDARAQPATTARSFQASNTIPSLRQHRHDVQHIATEAGATREQFEIIVLHMIKNGLQPERKLIERLLAQVKAGATQLS